jgi:hypothetical protein
MSNLKNIFKFLLFHMIALATLFQPNKIVKMDHVARELFSLVGVEILKKIKTFRTV